MVNGNPPISLVLLFSFLVTNKVHTLYIIKLFYLFIRFNLLICWVLKSLMVRVLSFIINSMVKRYMTSSRVSVRLIQSVVLNLFLFQSHTRSKDPLRGGYIKQRCERKNISMLDLLYNDREFFYIESCWIKIVMYLIDCYSIIDVV